MGFHFVRRIGGTVGPANLLLLSDSLLGELGIGAGECGLFRRTDSEFVHFPCTLGKLKENAKPAFSVATRRFLKSGAEAVVFRSNGSVFDREVTELLADLSAVFPAFSFFWANRPEAENVSKVVGAQYLEGWAGVAVLSFSGLYWYNITAFIPAEITTEDGFDASLWKEKIREVLTAIAGGKVEKSYVSEPVPNFPGSVLRRVVGSNFADELSRTEKDVLVLFSRERDENSRKAAGKLRKLADRFRDSGSEKFDIWTVDVTLNQIAGGFPVTRAPAIALYPADDRTEVRVVPREKLQILLWFTAKYGTQGHEIAANLTKPGKIDRVSARVEQLKAVVKPEVASRLKYTLDDLRTDIEAAYLDGDSL
jgi:hypothetical protein